MCNAGNSKSGRGSEPKEDGEKEIRMGGIQEHNSKRRNRDRIGSVFKRDLIDLIR